MKTRSVTVVSGGGDGGGGGVVVVAMAAVEREREVVVVERRRERRVNLRVWSFGSDRFLWWWEETMGRGIGGGEVIEQPMRVRLGKRAW